MLTASRISNALFGTVALGLLGVMAYALALGGFSVPGGVGTAVEVVVYYPDANSWRSFRTGVEIAVDRGLVDPIEQSTDSITIRDHRDGRAIRFVWDGALGIREIRESLARRIESETPPVAVIGSTNTALTVGLAEELAEHRREKSHGPMPPVLLIPSATSVRVQVDPTRVGETATTPLLAIYEGRSFRFCLNNERLAARVVEFLADRRGERPAEAIAVIDRDDPFSIDLARYFEQSVKRVAPEAPTSRNDPRPTYANSAGSATAEEVALAESIWSKARALGDRPVWVLLTTQGEPANRILDVLRERAPKPPDLPINLRVLCGDGIGRWALDSYAGALPFPVYSSASSSASVRSITRLENMSTGQVEAEMIAALVACLDNRTDLAAGLAKLHLAPGSSEAIGRTLAFAEGERAGDDLGHVLEARPDEPALLAHEPIGEGRWVDYRWAEGGWQPLRATAR